MAEDTKPDLLAVLADLRPTKGTKPLTCAWLTAATPDELAAIRAAFDRGNTYTSIAKTMRKAGARVTLLGIRDHYLGDCESCRISLKS